MYDFLVERPTSISQAVAALRDDDTQVIAGGQTLIPTMKNRLAGASKLVSVTKVEEMLVFAAEGDVLRIGASTKHGRVAQLQDSGEFPALGYLAANIGDPAVRNRGTIGGSLANNDPAACYPAAVLASHATIVTDSRSIAADDFFTGMFDTDLREDELIVEVQFPIPQRAAYVKFEQPASRFALVGVFVAQNAGRVRVAITGASDGGVFRWRQAEEALSADFSPASVAGLQMSAEGMIADIHGSARYRAHLVQTLTSRAVAAAS